MPVLLDGPSLGKEGVKCWMPTTESCRERVLGVARTGPGSQNTALKKQSQWNTGCVISFPRVQAWTRDPLVAGSILWLLRRGMVGLGTRGLEKPHLNLGAGYPGVQAKTGQTSRLR